MRSGEYTAREQTAGPLCLFRFVYRKEFRGIPPRSRTSPRALLAKIGEQSTNVPQSIAECVDNRNEVVNEQHEETRMLRRTMIFFAIVIGLPVLTAIALAWAR